MEVHTQELNNCKAETNNDFSNIKKECYHDVVKESVKKEPLNLLISNIKHEYKYKQLNDISSYKVKEKSNVCVKEEGRSPEIKFVNIDRKTMETENKINIKEEETESEKCNKTFMPFVEDKIEFMDEKIIPENLFVNSYSNIVPVSSTHVSDIQMESNQDSTYNFYEDNEPADNVSDGTTSSMLYSCNVCKKSFKTKNCLSLHLSRTHSSERKYICDICLKSFKTKQDLLPHMVVHSDIKKFSCKVCGQSFKRNSELTSHSSAHSNECPFQCEHCSKCFKKKNYMYIHILKMHPQDGKNDYLSCQHCGKFCKSKNKLTKHLLIHNVGCSDDVSDGIAQSILYSCHECKKSFKTKKYLFMHMTRIHSPKRCVTCDICSKSFATKDYLSSHIKIHSNNRDFLCDVCGKSFKTKNILRMHSVVHRDNKKFSCDVCGKSFKIKNILRIHSVVHCDNKEFSCDVCGKFFKTRNGLVTHSLVHSNKFSFHCEHCDKCYKSKCSIYRHIFNVHI